jgi:ATP-dependent DNA helicase RecG
VGVREENGIAQRPVLGVETDQLDAIQRAMIGFNNLIRPVYAPKLFIEEVDGSTSSLWVPGGSNRPYEVPEVITAREKAFCYYIRKYASSVKANLEEQQELISLANKVPFDDRANTAASIDDVSMLLVRNHLRVTGSRLAPLAETRPKAEILGQMELLSGPAERQFRATLP